jgi:hypothetical protein
MHLAGAETGCAKGRTGGANFNILLFPHHVFYIEFVLLLSLFSGKYHLAFA